MLVDQHKLIIACFPLYDISLTLLTATKVVQNRIYPSASRGLCPQTPCYFASTLSETLFTFFCLSPGHCSLVNPFPLGKKSTVFLRENCLSLGQNSLVNIVLGDNNHWANIVPHCLENYFKNLKRFLKEIYQL